MKFFPNTLEGWRFLAIIFMILYFLILCGCSKDNAPINSIKEIMNGGRLYTGCKGGMHSDNDGCGETHINYCY